MAAPLVGPLLGLLLASLLLALASGASASLVGDDVTCDGVFLLRCARPGETPVDPLFDATNTVSGQIEFDLTNLNDSQVMGVNLDANSIVLRNALEVNLLLGGAVTVSFRDLDWTDLPGEITGVLLETTGITGLANEDISFGADFVTIDPSDTTWEPGGAARLTLETAHIPEPSTALLLILGLAGLTRLRSCAI